MNNVLGDYYLNAKLSQAAYGIFDSEMNQDVERYIQALTDSSVGRPGMSVSQAREFIGLNDNNQLIGDAGFSVVDHYTDNDSGFAATVFQDRATGEYHFSIRGTEITDIDDIIAAGNLGVSGVATRQVESLMNYYFRLITPENDQVPQYELTIQELTSPPSSPHIQYGTNTFLVLESAGQADGLDALGSGTQLNLAGHSLGGHLSVAFARLFPGIVEKKELKNSSREEVKHGEFRIQESEIRSAA